MKSLISTLLLLSIPSITFGFSAGGHRIIAEIAWQNMGKDARYQAYIILKGHPRYALDFLDKMPDSVRSGDDALKSRWLF